MMLGEPHRPNPTVHVPPWLTLEDDRTAEMSQSFPLSGVTSDDYYIQEALTALQRYLPCNDASDLESECSDKSDAAVDAYSCDHFRMFEFKVRRCARGRSHDWTECPYAHPGEKARRRDPRKFHYSGTACPDFRKGHCKKGDSCEFAHGVFECWLHPARYRTQPCKDGTSCRRRVCFFAHTHDQLRVLPSSQQHHSPKASASPSNNYFSADSFDGSPLRQALEAASCGKTSALSFLSSSSSISPPMTPPAADSPPMSPMTQHPLSRSLGSSSINEMVLSMRNLQLGKVKSLPSSWKSQMGSPSPSPSHSSGFGSPRGASLLRSGFCSLPSTPTQAPARSVHNDLWDLGCEEEPAMERVESGRDLRAKMFERLSKENSLDRVEPGPSASAPDVDWVSDLVK